MDPMYGQRAKQCSNFLWPHLSEPQMLLVLTLLFRLVLMGRLLHVNHYLELQLKIDFHWCHKAGKVLKSALVNNLPTILNGCVSLSFFC